jgi:hypothetical protein|nr:MAG TPA: hypothetical protein [Caudoviricetes sp.]
MDTLEKFIDNVHAGKGRYGLCDACLNRQGDYCLFHNLYRRDENKKHAVTAQKLERVEYCSYFNYAGWLI